MNLDNTRTTNKLLLMVVVPLVFYILVVLKFIFIPLMFALFIALLFTPIMRWLRKRYIPEVLSFTIVLIVLFGSLFVAFKLIQLSGNEIAEGKQELLIKLDDKIGNLINPISGFMNLDLVEDQGNIKRLLQSKQVSEAIFENFGLTFNFVQKTLTMSLMALFFLILLLAGSWNIKMLSYNALNTGRTKSLKTFISVEKSISLFLKVKFLVSLLTGIGFGLICYLFGISFPFFWGLFAFVINFVQMVGSFISTILLSIFAYLEIDHPGTLLAVILLLTGIQVIFGSIVEPILMGRSFSINIITVLIMLMFWGFLWGVPGLILAIPMTVLIKTILAEYSGTEKILRLMS